MNLRAVALVSGVAGGSAGWPGWCSTWPDPAGRDGPRRSSTGAGWCCSASPWSASVPAWSAGARVWLRVIVGIAFPALVWSVLEVFRAAGDPEVVDGVFGGGRRCSSRCIGLSRVAASPTGRRARRGVPTAERTRAEPSRTTAGMRQTAPGFQPRGPFPGGGRWTSRSARVAMISLHTSPLDQPGTGDAGGMNVYVIELARQLAAARHRGRHLHPRHDLGAAAGRRGRRRRPGPPHHRRPVRGADQGRAARAAVRLRPRGAARRGGAAGRPLRRRALPLLAQRPGRARWRATGGACRWCTPMHTMAKVKNDALADGDTPEPLARIIGEEQVVEAADMLIANTDLEAKQLINLYDADPGRVEVVHPGVDLVGVPPGRPAPRRGPPSACPADAHVLLFAGRIQPLKAPDVLLRAVAVLLDETPDAALAAGRPDRRRSVRHRPRAPRVAGPARRRARARRRRPLRAAGRPGRAGPVVRGRDPGRRTVLQRVVRPGRRRGPGHRYAGRRRGGRRPDHGRPRRAQRAARRQPRAARLGRRDPAGRRGRRAPRRG